ncbi:MAG: molybdopterin converting factor subunit 1 [Thermoplasmata archaeon]
MRVKIRYFAGLRDITGKETEIVEVKDKARIKEILEILYKKYPEMLKSADIIVARNRQYAEENEVVAEGDEIALLPPVSGG